jgi:fluoride ion exporter CrcB/FEX
VAECIVSILCPVSIVGVLDLSATALNVIGPFIAGVVHAFDESLNDTRWHRYCAAFQAGFVGVFTSYTFMAEQSATLTAAHGLLYGGAYVVASMAAGCLSFRAGGVALRRLNVLLRGERPPRPPSLASARALVRQLCAVVLLFWVWVVLGPAGMVHDPMIFWPESSWERRAVSKWEDVRHLALGMLWLVRAATNAHATLPHPTPPLPPRRPAAPPPRPAGARCPHPTPTCPALHAHHAPTAPPPPSTPTLRASTLRASTLHASAQSAGLHLSRVVGRGPSSGAAHWWGAVQWGPLRANLLGCALLVLLRTSDRLGLTPHHSLAAAKLRTSGCGALATSNPHAHPHPDHPHPDHPSPNPNPAPVPNSAPAPALCP